MKGFGDNYKSRKKIKKKPQHDKEQIVKKAINFHSRGNIPEATKYYQYCIKQKFNDCRVFSNYGLILQNMGKLKEAEFSYRKSISLNPDFANAHLNLGNILRDLGRLEEAKLSTLKAIKLNPNLVQAHTNFGVILKNLGKYKEAEVSFRKAIALNPNFEDAHYNLGNLLINLGKFQEAEVSLLKVLELNPDFVKGHLSLGNLLNNLGKFQEAEVSFRKAIALNPNFEDAHYNLGNLLINLGKFQEAEVSLLKVLELNPDFVMAYNSLSLLKYSENNQLWQDLLFAKNILNNKLPKEKIDIYFARANVHHKQKNYKNSSKNLQLANNLKLDLRPTNADSLINKSNILFNESDKMECNNFICKKFTESIFIVGMPRSGSTLLESILSMKNDVCDLGEINILEESFVEYKKTKEKINLAEIYSKKIKNKTQLNITTNKWLYNYQYAGIIANQIFNAKIIHCYRNPLDNILSIYRAHFASGNEYSSSLEDCANVYLDQEEIMTKYKSRFKFKIYNLNYESLVIDPNKEIKSLISWLGWEWSDSYLTPHLNSRAISTRSNIEVRSPINSNSIGGWKNYRDMLKPAIEILTKSERYRNLLF